MHCVLQSDKLTAQFHHWCVHAIAIVSCTRGEGASSFRHAIAVVSRTHGEGASSFRHAIAIVSRTRGEGASSFRHAGMNLSLISGS